MLRSGRGADLHSHTRLFLVGLAGSDTPSFEKKEAFYALCIFKGDSLQKRKDTVALMPQVPVFLNGTTRRSEGLAALGVSEDKIHTYLLNSQYQQSSSLTQLLPA